MFSPACKNGEKGNIHIAGQPSVAEWGFYNSTKLLVKLNILNYSDIDRHLSITKEKQFKWLAKKYFMN